MNRRVKNAFGILCAAVLGTVLGRLLRESYIQPNEDGSRTPNSSLSIPDLIPGLVAAGRTRDVPWVWLRIPMWLTAFVVNFSFSAAGGDMDNVRETITRLVKENSGIDIEGILSAMDTLNVDNDLWS